MESSKDEPRRPDPPSVMWLARIPVSDRAVLQLAGSLRETELVDTAERLERAYDHEATIVAPDSLWHQAARPFVVGSVETPDAQPIASRSRR